MGHETVLATLTLFGHESSFHEGSALDLGKEYNFLESITAENDQPNSQYVYFSLVEFDKPVVISHNSRGMEREKKVHSSILFQNFG